MATAAINADSTAAVTAIKTIFQSSTSSLCVFLLIFCHVMSSNDSTCSSFTSSSMSFSIATIASSSSSFSFFSSFFFLFFFFFFLLSYFLLCCLFAADMSCSVFVGFAVTWVCVVTIFWVPKLSLSETPIFVA